MGCILCICSVQHCSWWGLVLTTGGRLQPVLMRHPPSYRSKLGGGGGGGGWGGQLGGGLGWRVLGGVRPRGGGIPKVGGPTRDPQQPHAYLQGGCVSGAGLGKLLVAVVKQGLQIGRCVHSGCGDLHFATNGICLAPRLANLALKTWMV